MPTIHRRHARRRTIIVVHLTHSHVIYRSLRIYSTSLSIILLSLSIYLSYVILLAQTTTSITATISTTPSLLAIYLDIFMPHYVVRRVSAFVFVL